MPANQLGGGFAGRDVFGKDLRKTGTASERLPVAQDSLLKSHPLFRGWDRARGLQGLQDRFVGCRAFDRGIVRWIKRSSAADAGGDRFLGGTIASAGPAGRGLDAVRGFHRLDALGQFGNARPFLFPGLMGRGGESGLELVTQGGQFGQVGIERERLTEPGLVVAKLGLGDGEVLSAPDRISEP